MTGIKNWVKVTVWVFKENSYCAPSGVKWGQWGLFVALKYKNVSVYYCIHFPAELIFPHLFVIFLIFCIKLGFSKHLKVADFRKVSNFLSQNQHFEVFSQYVLETKLCLKLMS